MSASNRHFFSPLPVLRFTPSFSSPLLLSVCLPCSWLWNNAATFAEIILLHNLSNCSGCGRGVSAAPLARPTAPMSVDLNETLRYSYIVTGTVLLRKRRERGRERERRGWRTRGGNECGWGGCETTGRWRWAWLKQWARTKQDEIAVKRPPPLPAQSSAQHVPPDCPSGSENGLHFDNGRRQSQRSRQLLICAASYQWGRSFTPALLIKKSLSALYPLNKRRLQSQAEHTSECSSKTVLNIFVSIKLFQ